MIYILIGLVVFGAILRLFDPNRSRGYGYQPKKKPGLNRITPPGHKPNSPLSRYTLGGTRLFWDIRPQWLWDEMWKIEELPYGVMWADKLRSEIAEMNSGYIREGMVRKGGLNSGPSGIVTRPPPPSPMRRSDDD